MRPMVEGHIPLRWPNCKIGDFTYFTQLDEVFTYYIIAFYIYLELKKRHGT